MDQPTGAACRCLRCGRTLTSAKSIATGYGRACRANMVRAARTVDLSAYRPEQLDKATAALAMGALVRTSEYAMFRVASSDGSSAYLTGPYSCTCQAGQHGRKCWHRAAVAIISAPVRRAA